MNEAVAQIDEHATAFEDSLATTTMGQSLNRFVDQIDGAMGGGEGDGGDQEAGQELEEGDDDDDDDDDDDEEDEDAGGVELAAAQAEASALRTALLEVRSCYERKHKGTK